MSLDARQLEKNTRKLRKLLKTLPKDPAVDQVHDLRTRARRVESALHALSLDSSDSEQALLAGLKRIRRRAGKVRDMDVLMSHLLERRNAAEEDCVIRVAHHLGLQRYRHSSKLHRRVQRYGSELRRRLKRVEHKLTAAVERSNKADLDGGGGQKDSKQEALVHAVGVALRLSQELAAVRRLGPKNLHAYRIQVKRLRYVLEIADEHGHESKFLDELKNVQDCIGEWHDWVQLHTIASDLLQHDGCKLIAEIQQVEHKTLTKALKVADQMRRRYLQPSAIGTGRKENPRRAGKTLLPFPAIAASSQIAA